MISADAHRSVCVVLALVPKAVENINQPAAGSSVQNRVCIAFIVFVFTLMVSVLSLIQGFVSAMTAQDALDSASDGSCIIRFSQTFPGDLVFTIKQMVICRCKQFAAVSS